MFLLCVPTRQEESALHSSHSPEELWLGPSGKVCSMYEALGFIPNKKQIRAQGRKFESGELQGWDSASRQAETALGYKKIQVDSE